MSFDDCKNFGRDILGIVPEALIPLLEDIDLDTSEADVEFNIVVQAWPAKVR